MPSKMTGSGSQCHMVEQPSWSSPSASPSPPPPPLPPPVAARWARTEQNSAESCPHCRGRLASLPTRTTSLSSYSCKDRGTPVPRPPEDEDSFPVICDRELHSLHRNIPALRRRDVDTATIKQHYYPEGGWGWLVCGAAFLAHLLTSGLQLAFGLLYLYTMKFLIKSKSETEREFYVMATVESMPLHLSPILYRKKLVKNASLDATKFVRAGFQEPATLYIISDEDFDDSRIADMQMEVHSWNTFKAFFNSG
ncbi:hypothetical protein GWI33_019580 [Rhynchophorus ferrugineus]|uniref:Uncharacterized protein n=1 Tax=Rhynchophorus ferrugineus TaxID=354439 RepID=A0A834HSF5_RHYFE|nr:hypothetical protein GWI33_019580 [Rhynchophorus ferrugineus]